MRQIVLDTETTGIGHENGHRLIEVGCVLIENRRITDTYFHTFINPERDIDEGAFRVHGISSAFLADKPLFKEVVKELLAFINDAELIIHNASFDIGFLNAELKYLQWEKKIQDYCVITDTLQLARVKHPGQRNSLDALCKRYEIDNTHRKLHGALLDAQILAQVYLAMTGGQCSLFQEELIEQNPPVSQEVTQLTSKTPLIFPTEEEKSRHYAFLDYLFEESGVKQQE